MNIDKNLLLETRHASVAKSAQQKTHDSNTIRYHHHRHRAYQSKRLRRHGTKGLQHTHTRNGTTCRTHTKANRSNKESPKSAHESEGLNSTTKRASLFRKRRNHVVTTTATSTRVHDTRSSTRHARQHMFHGVISGCMKLDRLVRSRLGHPDPLSKHGLRVHR